MATYAAATPVSRAGVLVSGAAVAASDKFANSGKQILLVINADIASTTVTFTTRATLDGLAAANLVVTVGAGASKLIGPFPPSTYNDSDGYVTVSYSNQTTVTAKVLTAVPELTQA